MNDHDNQPEAELVSVARAAEMLQVCPRTVRNMIHERQLSAIRFGRRIVRIKLDSIRKLIEHDSTETKQEITQ